MLAKRILHLIAAVKRCFTSTELHGEHRRTRFVRLVALPCRLQVLLLVGSCP